VAGGRRARPKGAAPKGRRRKEKVTVEVKATWRGGGDTRKMTM
jgi:hypothetical protein